MWGKKKKKDMILKTRLIVTTKDLSKVKIL